jgi:hypothetical protein
MGEIDSIAGFPTVTHEVEGENCCETTVYDGFCALDDRAAALDAHLGEFVFHARPDTAEVDRVDPIEHFSRLVGGIAGRDLDSGVVERHVEPAERVDRGPDGVGDAGLLGHVALDTEDLVPCCSQPARPMPEPAPVTRATWPLKS